MTIPWWRDAAGLALVVLGALTVVAGLVYAFVLAPLAAALITGGIVVIGLGVALGRYDPERAHARREERVRRSVEQPQPEQAP